MNERDDYADPKPVRTDHQSSLPLKRRLALKQFALAAAASIVAFGLVGFAVFRWLPQDHSGQARGSPEYAERWRAILEPLPDPETAQTARPEVRSRRFPNGEWAFGVGRDSHKYRDGGTIVVKDSTDRVRAFFGHVCGDGMLEMVLRRAKSLGEFYNDEYLQGFQFREHQFTNPAP